MGGLNRGGVHLVTSKDPDIVAWLGGLHSGGSELVVGADRVEDRVVAGIKDGDDVTLLELGVGNVVVVRRKCSGSGVAITSGPGKRRDLSRSEVLASIRSVDVADSDNVGSSGTVGSIANGLAKGEGGRASGGRIAIALDLVAEASIAKLNDGSDVVHVDVVVLEVSVGSLECEREISPLSLGGDCNGTIAIVDIKGVRAAAVCSLADEENALDAILSLNQVALQVSGATEPSETASGLGLVVGEGSIVVADGHTVLGDGGNILPLVGGGRVLDAASSGVLESTTSALVDLLVVDINVEVVQLPVDIGAEG